MGRTGVTILDLFYLSFALDVHYIYTYTCLTPVIRWFCTGFALVLPFTPRIHLFYTYTRMGPPRLFSAELLTSRKGTRIVSVFFLAISFLPGSRVAAEPFVWDECRYSTHIKNRLVDHVNVVHLKIKGSEENEDTSLVPPVTPKQKTPKSKRKTVMSPNTSKRICLSIEGKREIIGKYYALRFHTCHLGQPAFYGP